MAPFIVVLGADSFGVMPLKPSAGISIAGGGVGARIGDVIPDGRLSGSGHNMGTNHPIISRLTAGATGGDVEGTISLEIFTAGPVTSTVVVADSFSNSVTLFQTLCLETVDGRRLSYGFPGHFRDCKITDPPCQ